MSMNKVVVSVGLIGAALWYGHVEPSFAGQAQDVFKLFLGYWFGKVIAGNGNGHAKSEGS